MGGMGFISSNHATILRNNALINLHSIDAARTFGEKNCDGAWIWHYESGVSGMVNVLSQPYAAYFPISLNEANPK